MDNVSNFESILREVIKLSAKIDEFDLSLLLKSVSELSENKKISTNEAVYLMKTLQKEVHNLKKEVSEIRTAGIKWKKRYKSIKKDRDELVQLHMERTKRLEKGIVSSVKFNSKTLEICEVKEKKRSF